MNEFIFIVQKIKRMTLGKELVTVEGKEGGRDGGDNDKKNFTFREREGYLFIYYLKNIYLYIVHL